MTSITKAGAFQPLTNAQLAEVCQAAILLMSRTPTDKRYGICCTLRDVLRREFDRSTDGWWYLDRVLICTWIAKQLGEEYETFTAEHYREWPRPERHDGLAPRVEMLQRAADHFAKAPG